jgi:hypothetical protein
MIYDLMKEKMSHATFTVRYRLNIYWVMLTPTGLRFGFFLGLPPSPPPPMGFGYILHTSSTLVGASSSNFSKNYYFGGKSPYLLAYLRCRIHSTM